MEIGPKFSSRSVTLTPNERFFTQRAFTLLELIVVVVFLVVLMAIILPAMSKEKAKAQRISCVGRLKNIGLSHRIFATDNMDLFPWERHRAQGKYLTNLPNLTSVSPGEQVVRVFQSLSNELSTPKIIVCPADSRTEALNWNQLTTNNISYFLGFSASENLPQTILAGDRNLTVNGRRGSGRVEISGGSQSAEWDSSMHRLQGNVCLGDGSVQQMSNTRMGEHLKNTGVETNVMLFP
jgi:hypothetical protein